VEALHSSCTGTRCRLQDAGTFLCRTSLTLAAHTSANYWDAPPTERIGPSYSDVTSCTCTPLSCPMPKTRDSTVYFISEIHYTLLFMRATCSFCSLLLLFLSMFSLATSHLLSSRRRAHSKYGITSVLSVRVPSVRMKRDVPLLTWCSVRWRDNFRYLCVVTNSRVHRFCTHIMTGL